MAVLYALRTHRGVALVDALPVAVVHALVLLPLHLVLSERRLHEGDHEQLDFFPVVVRLVIKGPHTFGRVHHPAIACLVGLRYIFPEGPSNLDVIAHLPLHQAP